MCVCVFEVLGTHRINYVSDETHLACMKEKGVEDEKSINIEISVMGERGSKQHTG